ncbi:MAG: amidohydrolase family protein [Lachnospiraceae bacterium]|jgi:N-acetylglucosamine-6-phosphate deacetylase|nr:amidohydrolase family protein [Lachnospiraceae bacterium]
MYIHSKKICTPAGCVEGFMQVEQGKIQAILPAGAPVEADLDVGEKRILPGIVDTHNHGTMGYGMMGGTQSGEINEAIVRGYLKGLASQGVTACLPTADFELFPAIASVAKGEIDGARPIGIHSEGPYLNRVGEKGVDTGHPDIDMKHIEAMVEASDGMLKLFALAPELPGAEEAIRYLTGQGVRCAMAHTNMSYQEALRAFSWGITVTTHTANVMTGIHHRNMGALGACLLDDHVYNEMICDGLHVTNEMMELMLRVKNNCFDKVMMVSDNVPMAGAPTGYYRMPGMPGALHIDERGYCLSDTGRLCGSALPVIRGIRNLAENMGIAMTDIIRMSSENPARVYGAAAKGTLEAGKDADFIVIDEEYHVEKTYVEGRCVYDCEQDKEIFNPEFMKMFACEGPDK